MNKWQPAYLTSCHKMSYPVLGMCGTEVSGEPATLKWRHSASPKNLKFLPDYVLPHSRRLSSYRPLWKRW